MAQTEAAGIARVVIGGNRQAESSLEVSVADEHKRAGRQTSFAVRPGVDLQPDVRSGDALTGWIDHAADDFATAFSVFFSRFA